MFPLPLIGRKAALDVSVLILVLMVCFLSGYLIFQGIVIPYAFSPCYVKQTQEFSKFKDEILALKTKKKLNLTIWECVRLDIRNERNEFCLNISIRVFGKERIKRECLRGVKVINSDIVEVGREKTYEVEVTSIDSLRKITFVGVWD